MNGGGRTWGWLGLLGALGLGLGLGLMAGGQRSGGGTPVVDGLGVFGVPQDGSVVTEWGEVRVSAARRSLAMLAAPSKPQMLVFPHAAPWPAMAVPAGWRVAWVDGKGRILEVQMGDGRPLEARSADARDARMLFWAPGGSSIGGALAGGGRLLWSASVPMRSGEGG